MAKAASGSTQNLQWARPGKTIDNADQDQLRGDQMTEAQIIRARIVELKQLTAELQARLRTLEIEKAMAGLQRETEGANT